MSGYLPDGCTPQMIDRFIEGYPPDTTDDDPADCEGYDPNDELTQEEPDAF